MSEPKRPLLESSISVQAPDTLVSSKETYSRSDRAPAVTLQTPLGSGADLFTGRTDRVSHTAQEEPRSRKRKEMEAEIQIDELMSIMSEDMDCFDEQPSNNKGQQAQLTVQSSAEQKQRLNTAEASSLSKKQRVNREENETNRRPQVSLEKDSSSSKDQRQNSEQHIISIKKEQVHPSEYRTTNYEFSKPPERSSASKSKELEPFEDDDDASFIEVSKEDLISDYHWSFLHLN